MEERQLSLGMRIAPSRPYINTDTWCGVHRVEKDETGPEGQFHYIQGIKGADMAWVCDGVAVLEYRLTTRNGERLYLFQQRYSAHRFVK